MWYISGSTLIARLVTVTPPGISRNTGVQSLTDSRRPLKYFSLSVCVSVSLSVCVSVCSKVCVDLSSSHLIWEVKSQEEAPLSVDSSEETSNTVEERWGGSDTSCFTYAPQFNTFTQPSNIFPKKSLCQTIPLKNVQIYNIRFVILFLRTKHPPFMYFL